LASNYDILYRMSSPVIANFKTISDDIKERFDVNANIGAAVIPAEYQPNYEVNESASSGSVSLDSRQGANFSNAGTVERQSENSGNYVVNEPTAQENAPVDSTSGTAGAAPAPETDSTSDAQAAQDAAEAAQDEIDEEEFKLTHGGLTREEWDELINDLREAGYDWLADYLEAHPEKATALIDILSDPEGYWEGLEAEAANEYGVDAAKRQEVLNKILEALGLTYAGFDMQGHKYYVDENGNYYTVEVTENGVVVTEVTVAKDQWGFIRITSTSNSTTYGLDDSRFGLTQEEIDSYDSTATRISEKHAQNMCDLGLPENFDPRSISQELKDIVNEFKDKFWLREDDGYLYVDPRFYETMKRLEGLYNLLTLLFILQNAKQEMRAAVLEIMTGIKQDSKSSALDAVENQHQIATTRMRYQLYVLQRYANSHNQREYQKRLKEAREAAENEAESSGWNWFNKVITLGAGGAMERDEEYHYQNNKERIDGEMMNFRQRVEAEYEKAFGEGTNFGSGDPFSGDIDSLIDNELTFGNISVDVGGDKIDVNGDAVSAADRRLTALQNLRRLWHMFQMAKSKMRQTVAEIVQEREGGSSNLEGIVMGALDNAAKFEKQVFSNLIGQMQSVIIYNNQMVEAREAADKANAHWWVSMFTSLPILGMPLEWIGDFVVETVFFFDGDNAHFGISDVSAQDLIDQTFRTKNENVRRILNSDEEAMNAVSEYERRMWGVAAELDSVEAYSEGKDGIRNINEDYVNALRDKMAKLQNVIRLITMLKRAQYNLRSIISKIMRGSGEISELVSADTLDSIGDSKRLAFELKLQNLKNRIQEHNKRVLEAAALKQALWRVTGLFAGLMIATVAILTGGIGLLAAIPLIASLATLGGSLGNLIYNYTNKVDENSFNDAAFYGTTPEEVSGNVAVDAYRRTERITEQKVDTLTGDSHKDIGKNGAWFDSESQWGLDAKALMDVNAGINKLHNLQKLLIMLVQAQQDMRNLILASTTGVSTTDNSDMVQASNRASAQNKIAALELKREMIADIVAAHNRAVMQDADIEKSWIQFTVSAGSAIAGGLGAGLVEGGANWVGGMTEGMFWGGVINSVINLAYAITEAVEADTNKNIQGILDGLYKSDRRVQASKLEDAEQSSVYAAGRDLVTDAGSRNVAVNAVAFSNLSQKLEKLYNQQIGLVMVAQARNRMLKNVARIVGLANAAESDLSMEAVYEARESAQKNLDILKQKVQEFVDCRNRENQARRQLTLAIVAVAMTALNVYMKKFGGEEKVSKWLNDKFDSKSITVTDNEALKQAISGGSENWDGKIGLGDLAGAAANVITSENFARLVAVEMYDKIFAKNYESSSQRRVEGGKSAARHSSDADSISYYENKSWEEDTASAQLEIDAEKMEIMRRLSQEFRNILIGIAVNAKDGVGMVRKYQPNPLPAQVDTTAGKTKPNESETIPTSAASPASQDKPEIAPKPVEGYTKKYDELLAGAQFGSVEGVMSLVKKGAQLVYEAFVPEQSKNNNILTSALLMMARDIAQKLAKASEKFLKALSSQAVSPEAKPEERVLSLGIIASLAEEGDTEAMKVLKGTLEDLFREAIDSASEAGKRAKEIIYQAAQVPVVREILAKIAPAAALLAGGQVEAEEAAPASPVRKTLFELKFNAQMAEEQVNQGGQPDLAPIRAGIKKLAQLLPKDISGLNLKDIVKNADSYTPEKLIQILEQVKTFAKKLNLTPADIEMLDAAIKSLKHIEVAAEQLSFAASFLKKARSDSKATAEDLACLFQGGTTEEKLAALSKIRKAFVTADKSVPVLSADKQARLAGFLGVVSKFSIKPRIKDEARALLDELDSGIVKKEEPELVISREASLGSGEVEAGRVAVLLSSSPMIKDKKEQIIDESIEENLSPVFGGLDAHEGIISAHRNRENSASVA